MSLTQNQPKSGPQHSEDGNTKADATGRDSGLNENQPKPGHLRGESTNTTERKRGPDPGPQERRGYVRNQPNETGDVQDGNLAPDGHRTVSTSK